MIDSQYYEAQCYIRGTSLAAAYHYTNGAKSDYTYYVQNAHGDVVNLTDADGAVTKTYHYDAFGVERNINVADTNAFRYCGEYYDAETGTIYLRARYYDPSIGRFTQRDTVVGEYNDPLSLNLYTYCQNNPVLGCDPTGHAWYHWAIGAAIVVGLAALTIASAGTFALGMAAIGTAAAGASVGGATGVFAAATVASGTALAGSAMYASLNSESLQDFNEQGDWGVVAGVAGSGVFAGSVEYAVQRNIEKQTQLYNSALKSRDEMIKNNPNRNAATATAAYDIKTGKIIPEFSGPAPKVIHPVINNRANKIGGIGSHGLEPKYTLGCCSELRAGNTLLLEGSKIRNIRFVTAIRPRTGDPVATCQNCQYIFREAFK